MSKYCRITLAELKGQKEQQLGYSKQGLIGMFGGAVNPELDMERGDLIRNFQTAKNRMSISGAQPKRSAVVEDGRVKLTDTGGQFILKPSPEEYPHLAEVEHACMAMTKVLTGGRLIVADHGLLPLSDGELVYVTRRFDRGNDGTKIHQEQMDAAMGVKDKYDENVSYERIGQFIKQNVKVPLPSLIAFYEQVLVAYLLGNDDFHIRNIGLMFDKNGKPVGLTPAYDIVASTIYTNGDFLALPLTIQDELDQHGSTNGIDKYGFYTGSDFQALGEGIGLSGTLANRTRTELLARVSKALYVLDVSFVPDDYKAKLSELIQDRQEMLKK